MVVAQETRTEHDVKETLVQFLRQVDFAQRLWARANHGHITFWLQTTPVSHETERAVYAANSLIYRNFPDARFDFLVINPAMYEEPFAFEPPLGAQEIPLR